MRIIPEKIKILSLEITDKNCQNKTISRYTQIKRRKEAYVTKMDLKSIYHVAVPTAFYEDEELNIEATLAHILNLQEKGITSVLVCGTTGEQHSLSIDEKIQILKAIEAETRFNEGFEVIFGVGGVRQKHVLQLVEAINHTKKISAILLGFPPYIIPTQIEIIGYINSVLAISNKPVMLYNNPRRTGFELSLDTLLLVSKHKNLIGIKEAGDTISIPDLLIQMKPGFYLYAGGEVGLRDKVANGFHRLSSILGNLYPAEIGTWFSQAINKGNKEPFPYQETLDQLVKQSTLVYLKQEISKNEGLAMGKPRTPLGNI